MTSITVTLRNVTLILVINSDIYKFEINTYKTIFLIYKTGNTLQMRVNNKAFNIIKSYKNHNYIIVTSR